MKKEIKNDPTKPFKRVYNYAIQRDVRYVDPTDIPEFHFLRSSLSRTRSILLPDIPDDVDDVILEREWKRTWNGKKVLSYQDNNWGILVFATKKNYQRLERCDVIYADGTFKTCPPPYTQFVTIHGLFQERVLPFVMCLLTGKTVGQYRQLLQHVKAHARRFTGRNCSPDKEVCDIEKALQSAVKTELQNTRICSCYFHFCKSLWRRVSDLGLSTPYGRNRRLKKCIHKFMALAHLPVSLVRQHFGFLSTARSTRRLINRYPDLFDFIRYLENNYIFGQYTVQRWNVYDRDIDTRTNNHVEGLYFLSRKISNRTQRAPESLGAGVAQ
jgi:hypothetical protein